MNIEQGEDEKQPLLVNETDLTINEKATAIEEVEYEVINVPIWRRTILVLGAWFFMITIGLMTVSGFQNMRKILVDEKVYFWLGHNHTHHSNSTEPPKETIYMYGLMLTLSGTMLNLLIVVAGPMCDLAGPKITGLVGIALDTTGTFIFAFSSEQFQGYVAGYVLMTVGGMFVMITFLHLNNVLPKRLQFFFNSLVMSSADTGAVVFLIFQYVCERFTEVRLQYMMLGYLGILFLAFLYILFLQPMQPYPVGLKRVLHKRGTARIQKLKMKIKTYLGELWGAVKSVKFWLMFLYEITSTQLMYYYMQTFHEQLLYLTGNKQKNEINFMIYIWGILFLFTGVTVSVVMALLMGLFDIKRLPGGFKTCRNYVRLFSIPFAFSFLFVLISSWTVFSCVPILHLQYISIVSFLAYRSCVNSLFTTVNVHFFGNIAITIIGIQTCCAGMFTLTNYGWQVLAYDNYRWYNIGFGGFFALQCVVLTVSSVFWMYQKEKKEIKEDEKKETKAIDDEQETVANTDDVVVE